MKQVWHIYEDKESLWVKWVHIVILKGKSLWEIQPKPQDAWLWKRLLCIKDQYEEFTHRVIGKRTSTSFWFDPWHLWGRLLPNFPELKQKLNICLDAKVAEVISRGHWRLSFGRGWDAQITSFYEACFNIPLSNREDYWIWTHSKHFSVSNAFFCQNTIVQPHPLDTTCLE